MFFLLLVVRRIWFLRFYRLSYPCTCQVIVYVVTFGVYFLCVLLFVFWRMHVVIFVYFFITFESLFTQVYFYCSSHHPMVISSSELVSECNVWEDMFVVCDAVVDFVVIYRLDFPVSISVLFLGKKISNCTYFSSVDEQYLSYLVLSHTSEHSQCHLRYFGWCCL